MSNPIALVTGATGAIGPVLVSHLIDHGYTVRTLSRNPPLQGRLDPNAIHFSGSINDASVLDLALDSVNVIFHLAALLHIENPSLDLEPQYKDINVKGAMQVAERAANAGVSRIVYFSTVKVYGVQQRIPVTETHLTVPKTLYARTKLEGEQAVRTITGIDNTILRLSPVYGSYLKGSWERLVRSVVNGRFIPIGNLQNFHSLTHVDDVARAALLAATHKDAAGKTFNLVGHESPTMLDILNAIYKATGKVLPKMRIPSPLALLGVYSLEKSLQLLGKRSPLPVESLRQLIEDETYSGAMLRELGFAPQVPLDEGWPVRDTVA